MKIKDLKYYRAVCADISCTKDPEKIKVLNAEKSKIENYINSVSDYRVRRALEIYCIETIGDDVKRNWKDVAKSLNMTEYSVKQAVSRYLKNS